MAVSFLFTADKLLFLLLCMKSINHYNVSNVPSSTAEHDGDIVLFGRDLNLTFERFYDDYTPFHLDYAQYTCTGFVYSTYVIPSAGLFDGALSLLWPRPANTVPFRPKQGAAPSPVLIALLLLSSGNIQPNPGPQHQFSRAQLKFGFLNVNSLRNKAPLIQDLIADNSLDILALAETRVQSDLHPVIRDSAAPDGFSIQHVYRPASSRHPLGGGLAIISGDLLRV